MFRILYFRQVDKCLNAYTRSALGIEKKRIERGKRTTFSRARNESGGCLGLALRILPPLESHESGSTGGGS